MSDESRQRQVTGTIEVPPERVFTTLLADPARHIELE